MKFLDLDGLRHIMENVRLQLDCKQDKLVGHSGQIAAWGPEGLSAATIRTGDNIKLKRDGIDFIIDTSVSHTNLLDNWYFLDPVNQQRQTVYTGAGHTIDRWYSENLLITLGGGVALERTDPAIAFIQRWDGSRVKSLVGKTLTLSLLTSSGLSYCVFQIETNDNGNFQSVILTSLISSDIETFGPFISFSSIRYQMVRIVPKVSSHITLIAVKLEVGTEQTLAHQDTEGNWVLNDPPPDPALELLKCQRYYQIFSEQNMRPVKAVDFRPAMRANPALGTLVLDGKTYYTADANL